MHKVSRLTQEDIIWWMRNRMATEIDQSESQESTSRLFSLVTDEWPDVSRADKSTSEYEENVKILTSLLPDEVIYNHNVYTPQFFQCSIMIGVISGYGDLYDYHSKKENSNAQQFVANINTYLSVVFDQILKYDGDIISCTGKSFLVMWKTKTFMTQQNCMHMALDCALSIIKVCPRHEIIDNITLAVKMSIASGQVLFSLLGTQKSSHYIIFGPPINEANKGKAQAKPTQIILTKKSIAYLKPAAYLFEHINDDYVRVIGWGQNWQPEISIDESQNDISIAYSHANMRLIKIMRVQQHSDTRASMRHVFSHKLNDNLHKLILPTIVHALTVSESLNHLTETRLIVSIYMSVTIKSETLLEMFLTICECYQKIYREMCALGGNICNVMCKENNIIVLSAFGLRGFKQTFESKRALLCSMKCFKVLKTHPKVEHISIGISTGLTFCGVVGHSLRMSFSLIGRVVYTASELMTSYFDRITCDRETFLQSRLEARNFIFQESNHLYITYRGPIYEYIEYTGLSFYPRSCLSMFPILGRGYEVNVYKKMLDQHSDKSSEYNALIILGESRSGKSRLCEEFLFITPPKMPIFRIKLLRADKIPYKCIYNIFAYTLDFSQTNSAERKVKLQSAVKYLPVPELACLLNKIFDVNFPCNDEVKAFTEEERDIALNKIIKQISYFCFSKLWTIIIDDGNNIDDESWPLINAILETNKVFMVITISEEDKKSTSAKHLLHYPLSKKIRLNPISKWYYTGLACQVLQVVGIAKELDQVLQEKSQGNPGWIENFLISLVQGNYINVTTIPKNKIGDFNLTLAHQEMLKRSDDTETAIDTLISDDRSTILSLGERWNSIFRGVYEETKTLSRASSIFLSKTRRTFEAKPKDETVEICLVEPNMNINDVHPEIISDSKVIQILDSLSVYEQLYLKVSSVIGDIVPREMALNILNITEKQTCLAVEKFFKLGIFGCARGDFDSVYKNAILKPRSVRKTNDLVCDCEGLDILVRFENIPPYAYCGLMHFKMPLIREVIYGSLTSTQKYEYHSKSISYLEDNTRKCVACGGEPFHTILGKRYESNFQTMMKSKSFVKHMKNTRSWDLLNLLPTTKYFSMAGSVTPRMSGIKTKRKSKVGLRDSSSRDYVNGHNLPRSKMIKKFQYRESLTISLSNLNFRDCYCDIILSSFYDQMISHYFALNEMEKWMNTVFEYAHLSIELNNIALSNQLLEKALVVLETERFVEHTKRGESWKLSVIKAKIYTLLGSGMLKLGHYNLSYKYLMTALKNYGVKFPKKGTLSHKMKQIAQSIHLLFGSRVGKSTQEQYLAEYYDNLSECLSVTYEVFAEMESWQNAEIAAIWGLQNALMSGRDFRTIIIGFSNAIRSLVVNKKMKPILWFEIKSLLYCKLNSAIVDAKDLKVIITLYVHIFSARVFRGELLKAIDLGKVIVKLLPAVNTTYDYMNIFPLLIYILIIKKKFKELIYQMFFIQNSIEDTSQNGAPWYYGVCLVIQLETGAIIESYDTCANYYFSNTIAQSTAEEKSSELRFYTCLWLWCLRTGKYEYAKLWESKIRKNINILQNGTPLINLTTSLYYLECLILKYVYKLNSLATEEVMVLNSEIVKLISTLRKQARGTFIQPRLEHLKAYYVLAKDGEVPAIAILKTARKMAIVADLSYEAEYIKHSEMAWNHELSDTVLFRWKSDVAKSNLDFHDLSRERVSIGHYTFEPPIYC